MAKVKSLGLSQIGGRSHLNFENERMMCLVYAFWRPRGCCAGADCRWSEQQGRRGVSQEASSEMMAAGQGSRGVRRGEMGCIVWK